MSVNSGTGIHETLATIFRDKLDCEVPGDEIDLIENGMMDSLKFVELVFNLEKEFHISIEMDRLEIDQFRTFRNIVKFVLQSKNSDATLTTIS